MILQRPDVYVATGLVATKTILLDKNDWNYILVH